MGDATVRQLAVLRVIQHHRRLKGYPPSVREIGEALDISSTNGVADHLKALEKKGLLTREEREARTYVPTPAGMARLSQLNWSLDEAGLFDASVLRDPTAESSLKAFVVVRGFDLGTKRQVLADGSSASEALQRAVQLWGRPR